jgi:shikimate dehydrogenase
MDKSEHNTYGHAKIIKLGLVGGRDIARYTVADTLWETIADVTHRRFRFEIFPLANEAAVRMFYDTFLADPGFRGFNVALPWKGYFANMLRKQQDTAPPLINTVYKTDDGVGVSNTDVVGIEKALERSVELSRIKTVLILGGGGGGLAVAHSLATVRGCEVALYDIRKLDVPKIPSLTVLTSLQAIERRQFDLIINATPLGKYYSDEVVHAFSSPLDLRTMRAISRPATIVQEMNYLPRKTLFLQMAEQLGLRTVPGTLMLVLQAVESFRYYFGYECSNREVDSIILHIEEHVAQLETNVHVLSPTDAAKQPSI